MVMDALAAGVGPAAAAAGTATALTAGALHGEPYDLVISAGIAGGFRAPVATSPAGTSSPPRRTDGCESITAPQTEADRSPSSAPATGAPPTRAAGGAPRSGRTAAAGAAEDARPPAEPGGFAALVVADAIVAADLGAESADGFLPVTELGFGVGVHRPPAGLVRPVAEATGAAVGPVLTVSTVTGTADRAAALAARHAGALAEAMEGFGVAEAATAHGVPVLEIRATSNPVGPRDRAAWHVPDALRRLGVAFAALPPVFDAWKQHA